RVGAAACSVGGVEGPAVRGAAAHDAARVHELLGNRAVLVDEAVARSGLAQVREQRGLQAVRVALEADVVVTRGRRVVDGVVGRAFVDRRTGAPAAYHAG